MVWSNIYIYAKSLIYTGDGCQLLLTMCMLWGAWYRLCVGLFFSFLESALDTLWGGGRGGRYLHWIPLVWGIHWCMTVWHGSRSMSDCTVPQTNSCHVCTLNPATPSREILLPFCSSHSSAILSILQRCYYLCDHMTPGFGYRIHTLVTPSKSVTSVSRPVTDVVEGIGNFLWSVEPCR